MKKAIILLLTITYLFTMSCYAYGSDKILLPTISKAEALDIARHQVSEQSANFMDELDLYNNYTIKYNKSEPYGYSIVFNRVIDKIPYNTDSIQLFIDGTTGEVLNYYENFNKNISIPDIKSIIDKKTAEEKFKSAMGMELRYNKYISDKKIIAYLTYTAKEDFVINAETGNLITTYYELPDNGYFDITYMTEKTSGSAYFDSSVLTTSEADRIIRHIPEFGISNKYIPSSASYLRSQDGTYLITIKYTSGNEYKIITLNATNGIPVEYESNATILLSTKPSAQTEKIIAFANNHYADYLKDTIKIQNITSDKTIFLYERQVNGIPYKSNGLYICFDNHGNLTHLSFAWDNIEFPSAENIISANKAYENFFKTCGLELSYYKRASNDIVPVYKKSASGTGIIDAKLGIQLNYDGTDFYTQRKFNYIDIENHYSNIAASKLSDCDIYASSGNVYLKENITQQEYLLLISELIPGTKPILNTTGILSNDQREMLYNYMIENGVISKSEIAYNDYVTRADAVKYLIQILGYGPVAESSEIFIPHFADNEKIPLTKLGYIELARSMGIIKGDTENKFRPDDYISNGDSLIMIYNYLRG